MHLSTLKYESKWSLDRCRKYISFHELWGILFLMQSMNANFSFHNQNIVNAYQEMQWPSPLPLIAVILICNIQHNKLVMLKMIITQLFCCLFSYLFSADRGSCYSISTRNSCNKFCANGNVSIDRPIIVSYINCLRNCKKRLDPMACTFIFLDFWIEIDNII